LHQAMRDQIQVAKLAATTVEAHDAATALGILVNRSEAVIEGYCASMDSGAVRA